MAVSYMGVEKLGLLAGEVVLDPGEKGGPGGQKRSLVSGTALVDQDVQDLVSSCRSPVNSVRYLGKHI